MKVEHMLIRRKMPQYPEGFSDLNDKFHIERFDECVHASCRVFALRTMRTEGGSLFFTTSHGRI